MTTRIFLHTADRALSKRMARATRESGWEGVETNSIPEGLMFLKECPRRCDVAVVDVGNFGSGFAILDALENGCPAIPSIVLTEPGAECFEALAWANGAWDVLAKPVSVGDLIQAVTRLCEHGSRA